LVGVSAGRMIVRTSDWYLVLNFIPSCEWWRY
jgi:hypothetical protein